MYILIGFEDFVCDDDATLEQITEDGASDLGSAVQYAANHCKQMDHSTSPLFTKTLEQLREIYVSLEKQLNGKVASYTCMI